ncbi:F-box protein [Actinidia chinensis var. chinensis]|uniref:F-box protein n=1 Tax=Actinidia chinensis var. chinensis TaxID=1590841 RepID=A0A2R6RU52_ACTCC|nr:F-box protein [Actinidia chinensis var. chinensis]
MSFEPPWQVLVLVANRLDPKTLAMASCVSKSWFLSMSSDCLWQPICSTHFPYLSSLHFSAGGGSTVPYRRLYTLGRMSAKRRLQKPPKPHLSLHHLIFTVDVHKGNSVILSTVKPLSEIDTDPGGVFRFDIGVSDVEFTVVDMLDGFRLTWNVVLEGYKGVFTMMDCESKGGPHQWFTEELPSPGCCSSGGAGSGMVAELMLGSRESVGKMVVEKVNVGMMSALSWRYVSIDDALRYLQHFLVTSWV